MNLTLLLLLAGTCPLLGLAAPHAGAAQPRTSAIAGKYPVALKLDLPPAQLREHTSWVEGVHARNLRKRQSSGESAAGVERTFSFDGFRGYSGSFDKVTLEDIKRSKDGAGQLASQRTTVTLVDVKAFWGANGELSTSIACVEWAVNDILKNRRANSSVINHVLWI
ncbi:hypothetical protein FJTKL_04022 [Diaporthe vaccinii]|uniref:Inhibitor I9 domain-containing protein n=1 Tax=Diaporthe vaccinii TaxID=105482 RepID=A0ABR4DTZ3_9PEZI